MTNTAVEDDKCHVIFRVMVFVSGEGFMIRRKTEGWHCGIESNRTDLLNFGQIPSLKKIESYPKEKDGL